MYHKGKYLTKITSEIEELYSSKVITSKCPTTISNIKEKKYVYIPSYGKNKNRKKQLITKLIDTIEENENIEIRFSEEIDNIKHIEKKVYTQKGEELNYEKLISTIPLPIFYNLVSKTPTIKLISREVFSKVIVSKKEIFYHVIYCSDPNIRFNRIAKLGKQIFIEAPIKIEFSKLNTAEKKFLQKLKLEYLIDKEISLEKNTLGRIVGLSNEDFNYMNLEFHQNKIYFIGRYARWQYKLVENSIEDIESYFKEDLYE
ncbi:MAG: hypothetical protein ACRDDH_12055 [Cetobacterium sp.]|uniref:hypothetical protein n=1 Tax=Cetobacterium sp. TaxID=2071632 RepID=UPI003EE6A3C2